MCNDGCAGDEWDVVGNADHDIRANTVYHLWDTCKIGYETLCANVNNSRIPKQGCCRFPAGLPVDKNNDVVVVCDFLETIKHCNGV